MAGPTGSAGLMDPLQRVIRELSGEKSLAGRLRVLARAYPLIRSLTPVQRERLALHAGGRWVWKYLERYFMRDGILSEGEQSIRRALESVSGADPKEMRRMVREVRAGNRTATRDVIVEAVERVLEDEADRVEAEDKVAAAPGQPEKAEAVDEIGAAAAPESAESFVDDGVLTLTNQAPIRLEQEPLVLSPEPVKRFGDARAPEPAGVVGPEAPGGVVPGAVPAVSPVAKAAAASSALPDILSEPLPSFDDPFPRRDDGEGRGLLSAIERLHALRDMRRDPARAFPPGARGARERAELVRRLGPGWASRRAVSWMIHSGSVTDLDEALSLIGRLDTPTRRTWCLADLLATRRLSPSDRARVLDAAPTPSARRRLARRRLARRPAPR